MARTEILQTAGNRPTTPGLSGIGLLCLWPLYTQPNTHTHTHTQRRTRTDRTLTYTIQRASPFHCIGISCILQLQQKINICRQWENFCLCILFPFLFFYASFRGGVWRILVLPVLCKFVFIATRCTLFLWLLVFMAVDVCFLFSEGWRRCGGGFLCGN